MKLDKEATKKFGFKVFRTKKSESVSEPVAKEEKKSKRQREVTETTDEENIFDREE